MSSTAKIMIALLVALSGIDYLMLEGIEGLRVGLGLGAEYRPRLDWYVLPLAVMAGKLLMDRVNEVAGE